MRYIHRPSYEYTNVIRYMYHREYTHICIYTKQILYKQIYIIFIHTYVYMYIYVYVNIYVHMYTQIYIFMHTEVHVYRKWICVQTCTCVRVGCQGGTHVRQGDEKSALRYPPRQLLVTRSSADACLVRGLIPVVDREGILGLGSGLLVAGEETRE